jgi:hypothetical protein
MGAVPVTINNATITNADGSSSQVQTIKGDLTITGLEVGGGPVYPPDQPPGPDKPPVPQFPIVLPPGTEPPPVPGYPPYVGGGPIIPPETPIPPDVPPVWIPAWIPGYGWVAVPAFPHPSPARRR